jgi:hypothetical protein
MLVYRPERFVKTCQFPNRASFIHPPSYQRHTWILSMIFFFFFHSLNIQPQPYHLSLSGNQPQQHLNLHPPTSIQCVESTQSPHNKNYFCEQLPREGRSDLAYYSMRESSFRQVGMPQISTHFGGPSPRPTHFKHMYCMLSESH